MTKLLVPLLAAALAILAAEKKPVTLEALAQSAGRGEGIGTPVWSPDGKSFAYTSGKAVWVWNAAVNLGRQVAALAGMESAAAKRPSDGPFEWENRRVVHEPIQWTPDGKKLLLCVSGDLFLLDIESGTHQQLTATPEPEKNPSLSPDGKWVSFQSGNELNVLDVATRKTRRLTQDSTATVWNARLDWVYPEELDLGTAHWWSPDSARIAFLQFDVSRQWIYPHANLLEVRPVYEPQRYPKAGTPNADVRLGVIATAGGSVRWINLGDTRDALLARVNWTLDSMQVAVQRLNRIQNELALWFCDAATGAARKVLQESDPHWVNVSSDLRFFKDGKTFLWSSERDGYRHLYTYTHEGKPKKQLTKGNWDVKSVAGVDEERGVVYFHARQRSPLGQDLTAIRLDGSGWKLVTPEKGQHSASVSPSAEYFIDTFSSATEATRKTLRRISGEEVAVVQPPPKYVDEYSFLYPELVEVKAKDGAVLHARLLKPAGFDASKKYPAIVSVYGGPHSQSVCDCWTGMSWEQVLAQRGFVVWQLDNRGTAGRGHAWETKLYRRLGRQELADQLEGIEKLAGIGFVDRSRIGVYGWSYGGFMTLYSLLNAPGVFKAGIAGAPVTDWRSYDTIYTERYLGLPEDNEQGYRESSPVHSAAKLESALMLAHNMGDDNVLFQQSFQMMVALQNAGKQFETLLYPQRSHGVTGPARRHMLESMTNFFERHLK